MQHVPYYREQFSGDCDLHFHGVLSPYDSLVVAEPVIETSLLPAGGPRALYESFPQILVSVSDLRGLYLSGAFLIPWFQPVP